MTVPRKSPKRFPKTQLHYFLCHRFLSLMQFQAKCFLSAFQARNRVMKASLRDIHRIKTVYHSAWDNTYTCYYWEYDEDGNVTKEIHELSDRSIDYIRTYTYDEAGNCIKKVYESRGETYVTLSEYDENGNLLKTETEEYVIEFSGYRLYYNPYPVMIDELNQFIGK